MAAPCGQSQYGVEIHFAQRLASNVTKIRDRAVKRLRHWIAARSQKDGSKYRVFEGYFIKLIIDTISYTVPFMLFHVGGCTHSSNSIIFVY